MGKVLDSFLEMARGQTIEESIVKSPAYPEIKPLPVAFTPSASGLTRYRPELPSVPTVPKTNGKSHKVLEDFLRMGRQIQEAEIPSTPEIPTPEPSQGTIYSIGEKIEQYGREARKFYNQKIKELPKHEDVNVPVFSQPGILLNPVWWAENLPSTVISMAPTIIPGLGVSRYVKLAGEAYQLSIPVMKRLSTVAGATIGGFIGGGMEGSQTFQEYLDQGKSPEEARKAMLEMTVGAGLLNAFGLDKILKKAPESLRGKLLKYISSGLWEGSTEWGEEPVEAIIKWRDGLSNWDEVKKQVYEGFNVFPVAALTGFGGAVISDVAETEPQKRMRWLEDARNAKTPAEKAESIKKISESLKKEAETAKKAQKVAEKKPAEKPVETAENILPAPVGPVPGAPSTPVEPGTKTAEALAVAQQGEVAPVPPIQRYKPEILAAAKEEIIKTGKATVATVQRRLGVSLGASNRVLDYLKQNDPEIAALATAQQAEQPVTPPKPLPVEEVAPTGTKEVKKSAVKWPEADGLELRGSGAPFGTAVAARLAGGKRTKQDGIKREVVPVEGGFALRKVETAPVVEQPPAIAPVEEVAPAPPSEPEIITPEIQAKRGNIVIDFIDEMNKKFGEGWGKSLSTKIKQDLAYINESNPVAVEKLIENIEKGEKLLSFDKRKQKHIEKYGEVVPPAVEAAVPPVEEPVAPTVVKEKLNIEESIPDYKTMVFNGEISLQSAFDKIHDEIGKLSNPNDKRKGLYLLPKDVPRFKILHGINMELLRIAEGLPGSIESIKFHWEDYIDGLNKTQLREWLNKQKPNEKTRNKKSINELRDEATQLVRDRIWLYEYEYLQTGRTHLPEAPPVEEQVALPQEEVQANAEERRAESQRLPAEEVEGGRLGGEPGRLPVLGAEGNLQAAAGEAVAPEAEVKSVKPILRIQPQSGKVYNVFYTQEDFGTERLLRVVDEEGKEIGAGDPFHNVGIPKNKNAKLVRMRNYADQIVKEHETRLTKSAPQAEVTQRPINRGDEEEAIPIPGVDPNLTISDWLGGKRSGVIGTLIDTQEKEELKLALIPDNSVAGTYSVKIISPRGSNSERMQLEGKRSVAEEMGRFEWYMNTDNKGRFIVRIGEKRLEGERREKNLLDEQEEELKRIKGYKRKTGPQKNAIKTLTARVKADPDKWSVGDGVGWYVYGSGRKGTQINRGFRIIGIDPVNKMAKIRLVADTGFADMNVGNTENVFIGDLVRDKKYDKSTPIAEVAPALAPPLNAYARALQAAAKEAEKETEWKRKRALEEGSAKYAHPVKDDYGKYKTFDAWSAAQDRVDLLEKKYKNLTNYALANPKNKKASSDALKAFNEYRAALEEHYKNAEKVEVAPAETPTEEPRFSTREAEKTNINTPEFKKWFGKSKIVDKNGKPAIVYHGTTAPEPFSIFSVGESRLIEEEHESYIEQGSGPDPSAYLGSHFAREKSVANQFAKGLYVREGNKGRIYPVYLKIENPYIYKSEKEMQQDLYSQKSNDYLVDEALSQEGDQDENGERYDSDKEYREEINREAMSLGMDAEDPTLSINFAQDLAGSLRRDLQEKGYDGIEYTNNVEGGISDIIFEPNQAKSIWNQGTFSQDNPDILLSSQITKGAGGQTVEAVQRNVKSIQEEFGLNHPIVVVQSVSNLPEEGTVRERAVKESKTGMVIEGIYNTKDGKIYLVADSIRNRADALRVVLHETVGHLGLRKALGDKFNAILDTIYSNKEYAKAIDALATELKKTTRIATEEWFARKVQVGEVENSLWTKVIAKLRQVLRDLGFTIKFSDAELKSLIERSYTEARRGEEGAGTAKDVERFSTRKREEGAEDEGQTLEGFEKMMDEVEAEELMREAGKMMDQQIEEAENIRFATRAATQPTQPNPPTAQSLLSLDPETFRQKMARYFQNKLNRLEQAESKIKEVRGVQQLPLEQETSLWGGLWIGSASDEILEFDKQVVEGKDSLFKRMLDDNISLKEMGTYLWVRHAEERNDTIEIREGKENGAGIKTNVANRLKRWMDQRGKPYAQYAAEIDGLVRETLDRRYDAGLLTEKEYTALTTEWKNYVPLKSFYEDRPAMKTGKGFAITRKEFKKARGRFNPPENPLVQLIIDHHEAVIRAEKNKVDNAFLKMIQENPSNAWSWERQKYVPVYDKSGEIDYLKPITSKDEYIMKVDQETSDWFKNNYKRDIPRGSVIKITIKDKALREGMQNLMDNKVQGPKVLLAVNNFLRAVNTFINPEFVLTNFERDLQTALVHVWGENSGKMAIQVLKDVPGAIRGVWKEVREGTPNYHSQMYDRMKRLGGRVGFFDYKSLPELEADLEKKLDRYSKQGLTFGKGWDATLKFITDMNEAVESGVRLAFFEKLVESGVEEHRAALMAKELTVNFNKKGEFGTIMNTLWLFSNATTQGGARIFKAMKNPRVRKIVGTMTMFSFFNTILNRMLDPDDWDRYDQWTKDNYLLFPIPGMDKRVGIRLPYVYNVFHVAAQVAADIGMGKATVVDGMGRMVAAINDAVNPFSGRSWTMFMPTFSQPIFQVLDNKNFAGASIYKSQPEFGPKKPNFMQHFKTVNPATKVLTEWLNDISGGDTKLETSGFIDFNPEVMDHILEQIGGGAGRVIANTLNTVETTVLTKDFPPVKKIPFARQIIKGPSEWVDRSRAYDILDESRRRVMGTTKTDQFFESVKRALDNKEIEPDEAKRLRTEFRNNQRAAKGLPKLQQGRPGPPSPPRPPRPPSYRNQ